MLRLAPLLRVEQVTRVFGGLVAVRDVSLDVFPGEILGLIGPNGAGKTTLFSMIAGALRPTRGRILFEGHDVTRLAIQQRVARG
ncbi:MAG: ATP-binding cassette domain-containing protein, partial [Thermorudis peleae]|nr:ATP-binding cassette domain-containing protein [Thermorudis peleae]